MNTQQKVTVAPLCALGAHDKSRIALLVCTWIAIFISSSSLLWAQPLGDDPPPRAGRQPLGIRSRILLGELDPAVVAIRESKPSTAAELIYAVNQLIALREVELAKAYAKQLGQLAVDPKAMADIGEQVGPIELSRIVMDRRLDKEARELCRQIAAAVYARQTDPARLADLAAKATSDDSSQRRHAIIDLKSLGSIAVDPLVGILADSRRRAVHDRARDALYNIGDSAVAPLLAVLESEDEQLKANVLRTLARLQARAAVNDLAAAAVAPAISPQRRSAGQLGSKALLGRVPSREAVKKMVYRAAHEYLTGHRKLDTDADRQATLWLWDDGAKKLISVAAAEPIAAAGIAARLTHGLTEVDPTDPRLSLLKAVARLQRDKLAGGLDQPIDPSTTRFVTELAADSDRNVAGFAEEILEYGLLRDHVPAAIAAAEMLGGVAAEVGGYGELIRRRAPQAHPLVVAASHPDRRLRLAATRALLQLNPQQPYVGSSAVPAALRFFANVSGQRHVLVGDSRPNRRYLLAGLLNQNGYETDAYKTSAETYLAATKSPEYVAAFLSYTIGPQAIEDLLQEIRSDPRTADLPIGLIFDPKDRLRAEFLARDDPLTMVFVVPRDASAMQHRVDQLIVAAGSRFVSHQERIQQAAEATNMIAEISDKPAGMYDLNGFENVLERGLYLAQLALPSAKALGDLGSASAQRALVDAASQSRLPMASRSAAVEALARSIRKRGIGLTRAQIQRQGVRYDLSADDSKENEAILWSILEAIQNVRK